MPKGWELAVYADALALVEVDLGIKSLISKVETAIKRIDR